MKEPEWPDRRQIIENEDTVWNICRSACLEAFAIWYASLRPCDGLGCDKGKVLKGKTTEVIDCPVCSGRGSVFKDK